MPGKGSYGPAGKWVHNRAHKIMSGENGTISQYGEEKGKQIAYAIATQMAHKLGKTPGKGSYGTSEGKSEALNKFDKPKKEYKKTASLGGQDLRKDFVGGTKFPTKDSMAFSKKLLNNSRQNAEVGSNPSLSEMGKDGPTLKQLTPNFGTTKGDVSLPKIAENEYNDIESEFSECIQFLRAKPRRDGSLWKNMLH